MGVWEQSPARGKVNLDGGGSATAFASMAQARWVLQAGAVGWQNILNSCAISLMEIDNATSSGIMFTFMASTTSGFCSFNLGEHGIQASSLTPSRMVFNVGGVAGTYTGMFSGYYTGGG